MKHAFLILVLLLTLVRVGICQTTPNIGLNIPAHSTPNWDVLLNANFTLLDLLLSGNSTISGLNVAGTHYPITTPFIWLPYATTGPPTFVSGNQTDGTANNLVCRSFSIPNQITVTKFTATVAVISAGQTFNIGIYDNSGNLVRDSGAMSCGTATQVTSTVSSFTLTPGNTYAQCVAITDTTCALIGAGSVANISSAANKNATRDYSCTNTLAAGAMPPTCGTPNAQPSKAYLVLLEQ